MQNLKSVNSLTLDKSSEITSVQHNLMAQFEHHLFSKVSLTATKKKK